VLARYGYKQIGDIAPLVSVFFLQLTFNFFLRAVNSFDRYFTCCLTPLVGGQHRHAARRKKNSS